MSDLNRKIYLALAIIGIADAIFLSWVYLSQNFNVCSIKNTLFSCQGVAASGHTSLFGVPFWTTGVVWFPLALIVGLITFRNGIEAILIPFLMIGNIFTIYLWYLELAVIHSICPICLSLHLINYAMTGVAVWIVVKPKS